MHGSSGASAICPIPLASNQMCSDPTGSSLFDGVIPELTGLTGDMWAEHLVTLSPLNSDIRLQFEFRQGTNAQEMSRIESIEIVMINCTSIRIGATTITVWELQTSGLQFVASSSNYYSCDGLVRVCIDLSHPISPQNLYVMFDGMQYVYLGEIFFHTNNTCTVDSTVNVSTKNSSTSTIGKLYIIVQKRIYYNNIDYSLVLNNLIYDNCFNRSEYCYNNSTI